MATLKEVLANKAKYQDSISWELENGTSVTLGQLRQLSEDRQAAITKAESDMASRDAAIKVEEKKLHDAQLQTANVYTDVNAALEAIKAGRNNDPAILKLFGKVAPDSNNDPFAVISNLENDNLLGPLVKAMKFVNEEAKKAQQAVASNLEVQKRMATSYINGTLEDRYDRVVPADKQEKIPLNKLIQDAVNNKRFTSDEVPDIKWAYRNATYGDDQAARETAIRAEERKKVETELAERNNGIQVPSPAGNMFGIDVHNRSGNAVTPFKSLEEAFAAAAKDKDIWSAVDQITN